MEQRIYETPRLILKTSNVDMAQDVLDFYRDNAKELEQIEPMGTPDFYTLSFQQKVLHAEEDLIKKGTMIRVWIYLRQEPDILIGTVSCHNIRYGSFLDGEVGYKIDHGFRRLGYCREALQEMMEILSDQYNLHRITATVLPTNTASIHLLESLGYEREGLLRQNVKIDGQWKDHYLYSYLN